jgi:DNA-binding winged helix-turn-helix (wHTH) protein
VKEPTTIDPIETIIKRGLKLIKTLKKISNNNRKKNRIKQAFKTMAKKAVIGLQIPS